MSPRFIFVSSRCTNLIGEIPDYRWQDLSPSVERNRDEPEKPRKKDDHACDALRYGVMRGLKRASMSVPAQRVPAVGALAGIDSWDRTPGG